MKAIIQQSDTLVWTEVGDSHPCGPGTVRVRITATAVNRADLSQRAGHYPPPPGITDILGLECSGVVQETAPDVNWPQVGDEVCALLAGGGYAQEVVVPAGLVLPVPKGLSLLEAAAVPEVFTTAFLNLRLEGALQPGERVLIHAGASGVGTAAVQFCSAWGNPVVVTVGSEAKCRRSETLGARLAVNRKAGPWVEQATREGKFDVILDPVGGSYLESNIHSLNPGGRLINIGLLGGREGTLPLGPLLTKRLQVKGSVLRSRSVQEKTAILARLKDEVWPLFESKQIRPIIETVLPIEEAERAHQLVQSNQTVGKVLLRVLE
ncbi:MAG: NAD(P)H-quinone oxidoreductase [Vulcanimicrobiota bacterium]